MTGHVRIAGVSAVVLLSAACFASAPRAAVGTGFYGCRTFVAKHPVAVVRPRSIVVACGDGNFFLTGIRWTSWSTTRAAGTASAHQNDCTPYCAAGHFHAYPAAITLTKARACKGARVFTEIAWRFTGAKPHDAPRTGTTDFGCR